MRNGMPALLAAVLACGAFVTLGAATTAAEDIEITEWAVPWENTRPRDPSAPAGAPAPLQGGGHAGPGYDAA